LVSLPKLYQDVSQAISCKCSDLQGFASKIVWPARSANAVRTASYRQNLRESATVAPERPSSS